MSDSNTPISINTSHVYFSQNCAEEHKSMWMKSLHSFQWFFEGWGLGTSKWNDFLSCFHSMSRILLFELCIGLLTGTSGYVNFHIFYSCLILVLIGITLNTCTIWLITKLYEILLNFMHYISINLEGSRPYGSTMFSSHLYGKVFSHKIKIWSITIVDCIVF